MPALEDWPKISMATSSPTCFNMRKSFPTPSDSTALTTGSGKLLSNALAPAIPTCCSRYDAMCRLALLKCARGKELTCENNQACQRQKRACPHGDATKKCVQFRNSKFCAMHFQCSSFFSVYYKLSCNSIDLSGVLVCSNFFYAWVNKWTVTLTLAESKKVCPVTSNLWS